MSRLSDDEPKCPKHKFPLTRNSRFTYCEQCERDRLFPPREVQLINMFGKVEPYTLKTPDSKIGRNEPCPCGSQVKHKRCCLNKLVRHRIVS